jgi:ribonuclease HII
MPLQPFQSADVLEAGVDEAGRGPAVGRIYAAAVIWPISLTECSLVKDSKQIKRSSDMKISYDFIIQNAIDYGIGYATESEIDKGGVGKANMLAMHRALDKLLLKPEQILVDGNYFQIYCREGEPINYGTVVGGDHTYFSIAAASILAKYSRDTYIEDLCDNYPELETRYDIRKNKGYISAPAHKAGIEKYGVSQFHRMSFKCCTGRQIVECKSRAAN